MQDWLISFFSIWTSCFFQFSSSVNLAVVSCFSISVIYTSYSRLSCSCCSIFVFMEGAISKDATSLSKSICLILLSPSFTFQSLLYFPVALPDLETIYANFQLLLSFSWKWTIAFFFNICFSVCLFSLELLCDCSLDTLSCTKILSCAETHWGFICLSDIYGLLVWCDY